MSEITAMDDEVNDEIYSEERKNESVQGLVTNVAENRTPGEMLLEARLAHEYSVADLSAQTMLPRRTIEALEDNRFEELSQPVFARGYYRKCAKVLDMDADAVMDAYAAAGGAHAASRSAPISGVSVVPADVTPDRRRTFGTVFLIVILLVIAFAAYLFVTERADTPASGSGIGINLSTEADDSGLQIDTNDVSTGGAVLPITHGKSPQSDATTSTGQSSQSVPVLSAPTQTAANGNATVTQTASGSGAAQADTATTPPAEQNSAQTSDATTAAQSTAAPAATATALTLAFDQRSWVNVHDATGKQLLVGIYQSTTRTLDGVPPYKVVVGYAPGVTVKYQGQDVQFQVAGNNTARFSVGAGNP